MSDLEGSLKRSTLETSELHIHVRRHQENLKIKSDDVETSRRETDSIRDYLISADRKVSSLKNAVEEARSMLEQSDKCRRQLEQELAETQEEHAKLVFTNTAFDQEKRRLDADLAEAQVLTFTCIFNLLSYFLHTTQVELDEVRDHLKEREMKAKDCMIAASTIAEELHNEQEHSGILEADRKILENKLKDMQVFVFIHY